MKKLAQKLFDESARIDRTILIAGSMTDGAFSDDFNEFLDDEDESTIEECLGEIPDGVDIEGHGYSRNDSVCEWLTDKEKLGFLVKFATPVMEFNLKTGHRTFSWGYYSTKWIYAETLDDAIGAGLEWVTKRREAEEHKAKEGGAE